MYTATAKHASFSETVSDS